MYLCVNMRMCVRACIYVQWGVGMLVCCLHETPFGRSADAVPEIWTTMAEIPYSLLADVGLPSRSAAQAVATHYDCFQVWARIFLSHVFQPHLAGLCNGLVLFFSTSHDSHQGGSAGRRRLHLRRIIAWRGSIHIWRCLYTHQPGVVSSSGSSGMVEKSAFYRNELGAFRKRSGRIQGWFGEIEDNIRAKSPDFQKSDLFLTICRKEDRSDPQNPGSFRGPFWNAPEILCRKIRPLPPTHHYS
jgi:hypothetical protein